jgi:hypothetical protein
MEKSFSIPVLALLPKNAQKPEVQPMLLPSLLSSAHAYTTGAIAAPDADLSPAHFRECLQTEAKLSPPARPFSGPSPIWSRN